MSTSFTYTPPALPSPSPPAPVTTPSAQFQTKLRTFRDALREISPPWLRGPVGGGILYAIGVQVDALADGLRAGVKARFPGFYSMESLGIIGRERRIRRGRTETDTVYASRLMRWLDDHRRRGGPYALLSQLFAHYAPNTFQVKLIYQSGRRFTMDAAGAITRDNAPGWVVPDGSPAAEWAQWWLYLVWPTDVASDGLWDDPGTWDDGGVWDSGLSPTEVTDVRLIPREWNAAHAIGHIILVTPTTGDVPITVG